LRRRLLPALLLLAGPSVLLAQTSPFLPDPLYRQLVNEISGDRAFEQVRHLSHFHRTAGSRDFFAAAERIRGAAQAAGLEEVRLVRQKWAGPAWSCRSGSAWLLEPQEVKLADYGEVAVSIADVSRTTHLTAELVNVGEGDEDADYQARDVKGKVVLASGPLAAVMREAVWRRGALGILSSLTHRPEAFDAPDQVAWAQVPAEAKDVPSVMDGTPGTFAVMLSPRRARSVAKQLAAAGRALKVKIDIEADFAEKPEQAYVEGWIKGTDLHDQQIVLTAHIQEEMTSANDDGSGCASLLEIGRALTRLIEEGALPRPRRDIRFWWVNELASEEQFFRENPGEPRKMLLDINQDMVAARQSWGGRVQYASRLPWSLPHPLEDVMESVLGMVRDGNTSLLTTRGTSLPAPFTREITAVKGSREPFHARMVPYYDSTDHHAFAPARIGVPATSLTNWPDEYIHGTGDDLENIDATQLERNAVVVAGVALYFAGLRDEDVPALAGYVTARGRSRTAADLATAVAHLAGAGPAERDAAYGAARNLVRETHRREMAGLGALRRLGGRGRTLDFLAQATSSLEDSIGRDYEVLERASSAMTGRTPPNLDLTKEERAMAGKVFVPVADVGAFADAIGKTKPVAGLHAMMRFETLNFADGRRNAYEVYQAVAAEALSAGEWYYGTVAPADVLETLERAARAGAFGVKAAK
jgi:peptidase M28-like protein